MYNKGFTLIEMLIVIFVFVIGILAVFGSIDRARELSFISLDRFTAAYLAQEGMEIVRNIRDKNWLNGNDWNNGLQIQEGSYEVDYDEDSLSSYQDRYLNIGGNGYYTYDIDNSITTKFKRKITISECSDENDNQDNCLEVESKVFWKDKGKENSVSVKSRLYNWYSAQ